MPHEFQFPAEFIWGSATAAYQIEGAAAEDGKGKSIWDTFSHQIGKIDNGDTGDIACDHYHRWHDDVRLIKQLKLDAYRFSIAWTRILPEGRGRVNPKGLDFYSCLVDSLLEAGITPFVTLYHWDLPQKLQDDGDGWLRRGILEDFAAYANIVSSHLGDRVKHWITLNEPWVFSWGGYYFGEDAPGWHGNTKAALSTTHHAYLSHSAAISIIRANVANAKVGIVLDLNVAEPASDSTADLEAAERFMGFQNRWYLDPLFKGEYPSDMWALYGDNVPQVQAGDLEKISAPVDYLGINFYRRSIIAAGGEAPPVNYRRVNPPDSCYTAMGWEFSPRGLYDILEYVHKNYDVPDLYITENGAAYPDTVSEDGCVHDHDRLTYLRKHFAQAQRAIENGIPLKGYFVWSLLDNFEWAFGYDKRFGVIYVDYETQRRIIKDSGYFLATVADGP